MSYQDILYEVEDGIATVTMNRPDMLNAFTGVMLDEIIDAIDRTDADDDVRAVIFTGAGRASTSLAWRPACWMSTRKLYGNMNG